MKTAPKTKKAHGTKRMRNRIGVFSKTFMIGKVGVPLSLFNSRILQQYTYAFYATLGAD